MATINVNKIWNLDENTKISYRKLAKIFNISVRQISKIIKKENWKI